MANRDNNVGLRSKSPQHIIALTLIIAVGLLVAVPGVTYPGYDDAFITFRHSQNLMNGHGLVFNTNELALGTTTPLFAILLALLSVASPDFLPVIANLVSGIALIACAHALYEYARVHDRALLGFVAAIFFGTLPLLVLTFGGEMLLQCALVLWAFVFVAKKQDIAGSVFMSLACMVRIDSAIAAAALLVAVAVRDRRLPLKPILLFLFLTITFYGCIFAIYGSPFPLSVSAKAVQREIGGWSDFWPDAIRWIRTESLPLSYSRWAGPRASPDISVVRVALLLGVVGLFWRNRYWLKPMLWSALLAGVFTFTNPPMYHWYLVPLVWPLAVLAATGVDTFVHLIVLLFRRLLGKQNPKWVPSALAIGAVLLLSPAIVSQVFAGYEHLERERSGYINIAEWLRNRVPPGYSVYHAEIGYISYHLPNHRIIDPFGLVHPGVAKVVADGDVLYAYRKYDPDVVIYSPVFTRGMEVVEQPRFHERYVLVHVYQERLQGATKPRAFDIYLKRDLARTFGGPGFTPYLD